MRRLRTSNEIPPAPGCATSTPHMARDRYNGLRGAINTPPRNVQKVHPSQHARSTPSRPPVTSNGGARNERGKKWPIACRFTQNEPLRRVPENKWHTDIELSSRANSTRKLMTRRHHIGFQPAPPGPYADTYASRIYVYSQYTEEAFEKRRETLTSLSACAFVRARQ